MKIVDTGEYVSVLKDLVNEGHDVNMRISGNSMAPFLKHERDFIYFRKPEGKLKKGDMVFFQRDNGDYVIHRICKVNGDGTFDIVGDRQVFIERGVRQDQIFARVFCVMRKGKMLKPGDFCWDFFENVWIRMIPLRPLVYKLYTPLGRIKAKLG